MPPDAPPMRPLGPDPDAPPRPEFEFRSTPRPAEREPRPEERRARVGAAIRAAHGAGITLEWRIRSGAGASPRLWFPSRDGVVWWSRSLLPAYDREGWVAARVLGPRCLAPTGWSATRVREWPLPLHTPADPEPWVDALQAQLALVPEGYELRWQLRPATLARAPRPDAASAALGPPGVVERPRYVTPRPSFARAAEPPDLAPAWWCRVALFSNGDREDPATSARVARALESATRCVNGNGLRFRRRNVRRRPPEFAASESDVRDSFPVAGHPRGTPRALGPKQLAIGRREDGRPVGVPIEAGQGRHLAVLGETGMGKSSLLTAIARRVARDDGLVLFDPFGDTARAVRAGLSGVPAERIRWIHPGAGRGLNALRTIAPDASSGSGAGRRLNDLVNALRRVRESRFVTGGFWGPRLEEMLGRALHAAATLPGGTVLEAHALLAAEGRGFRQVPPESMEPVRALAERIRSRPEDADGARRLLFEVVRDDDLVRLLCARDEAFTASDLVGPGRIVLLAGDAPLVGETTARYLLSVFLALVWAELLARPSPAKTWVVLDEAQWFAHEALAEMLRMARRCDVHVVLATQAVGSLPEPVREALWTNVADLVVFRGAPADAREIARSVRGVTAESILALPRGEAFLLLGKGHQVERVRTARAAAWSGTPRQPAAGEPTRDDPAAPAVRAAAAEPFGETGVRPLLAALEPRVRDACAIGPIRISLRELRAELDPDGGAVRELGSRLSRCGALLSSGRDESGSFWWIEPSRLRRLLAESEPPRADPPKAPHDLDPSVYPKNDRR